MFINYIKLAIRLLIRNPFFTGINVLGLSIGFTAFYILWPYTQSEIHSDQFHRDYENIARLSWHHRWTDNNRHWDEFYHALSFCSVGKRVAEEMPEVKEFTRLVLQKDFKRHQQGTGNRVFFAVYQGDSKKQYFLEEHAAFADPNFFQFFSFPLALGDASAVLSEPGSVVISQQHRRKYFGNADPIDATIYLNDSIPLKVTGVFKDLPGNTHFSFDIVITTAGYNGINKRFEDGREGDWLGANYVKVADPRDFGTLQRKIDERRKDYFDNWENADPTMLVQPLKEVVFTDFIDNPFKYKSKNALQILRGLSLVILFLAWTNYIGLSITSLHRRLPEVGTRKVAGARQRDFTIQFFVESAIINSIAVLVAFTLVQLTKIPVEYLFHFYLADWKTILDRHAFVLVTLPAVGIVVTGIYPILVSTKKGSVDLLKKLRGIHTPWWIRSMVTFQYASAIVLLIWIVAVYFQLNHIINKNTGVSQDGILVIDCPIAGSHKSENKLDYFIQQSVTKKGVLQATISKSVMGDKTGVPFFVRRGPDAIDMGLFSNGVVDEHFLGLYDIKLLEGRNFQTNLPVDKKSVLLSRLAIQRMGFATVKESIGAKIILPQYNVSDAEIIGVYEDYEFEPFFQQAQAKGRGSILTYKNSIAPDIAVSKISLKVNLEEISTSLAELKELYETTFPLETFKWVFLDQNITRHYAQERIVRNQIMLFTLLAIVIACLGLLGTTSCKVAEKKKEIGIRKVLGARLHQIATILVTTTIRQFAIATVIGVPLAYFLISIYLERYSERLSFKWWHYALPVFLLMMIMFVTIAHVLFKASTTNPTESLRSE